MTCAGQASTSTVPLRAGWADTAPWVGSACRPAGRALELKDAATGARQMTPTQPHEGIVRPTGPARPHHTYHQARTTYRPRRIETTDRGTGQLGDDHHDEVLVPDVLAGKEDTPAHGRTRRACSRARRGFGAGHLGWQRDPATCHVEVRTRARVCGQPASRRRQTGDNRYPADPQSAEFDGPYTAGSAASSRGWRGADRAGEFRALAAPSWVRSVGGMLGAGERHG